MDTYTTDIYEIISTYRKKNILKNIIIILLLLLTIAQYCVNINNKAINNKYNVDAYIQEQITLEQLKIEG